MKKIIILLILLTFPLVVSAKRDWNVLKNEDTIEIKGTCSGDGSVRIDLFSETGVEDAVYTSGAWCRNERFEFKGNLLESSLPGGEYILAVNGKRENVKAVFVKKTKEIPDVAEAAADVSDEDYVPESTGTPETKFIGAFVLLQQSILDMREWLAETQYPAFMKGSMELALDGVDFAVAKVSDLVLSSEIAASGTENNLAETANSAADIPVDTPAAETPEIIIEAEANQPSPGEEVPEEILSLDGLEVPENSASANN